MFLCPFDPPFLKRNSQHFENLGPPLFGKSFNFFYFDASPYKHLFGSYVSNGGHASDNPHFHSVSLFAAQTIALDRMF